MQIKNDPTKLLIIGLSARRREGLKALLINQLGINLILQADDVSSAQTLLLEYSPAWVVLDFDLPEGDLSAIIKLVRAERLKTYCISIVDSPRKEPAALRAGADCVLTQGFSWDELITMVRKAVWV
jgi:DNA-binding NarL/FixJ family response regulator